LTGKVLREKTGHKQNKRVREEHAQGGRETSFGFFKLTFGIESIERAVRIKGVKTDCIDEKDTVYGRTRVRTIQTDHMVTY